MKALKKAVKKALKTIRHTLAKASAGWRALGVSALTLAAFPVTLLALVPKPPAPTGAPAANDAIGWFEGVFEDSSEVGILVLGVLLFVMGAAGMVWAIAQVMTNKATISEVGKIGLASAASIAFGTYALTQASAII